MDVLSAEFVTEARDPRSLPAPAFTEVAFAGRSNVGKSSLINALAGRRKLARTSSTPGATRGIHLYRIGLRDSVTLDLVDLPGYGFAQRSKEERKSWGPMIEDLLTQRASLQAVVTIVDVRRGLEEDDSELVEFLEHHGKTVLVVATKLDKLPASQRKLALRDVVRTAGVLPVYGFSAETGEGRDRVWRAILKAASIPLPEPA